MAAAVGVMPESYHELNKIRMITPPKKPHVTSPAA
jgi:hypothetical protein